MDSWRRGQLQYSFASNVGLIFPVCSVSSSIHHLDDEHSGLLITARHSQQVRSEGHGQLQGGDCSSRHWGEGKGLQPSFIASSRHSYVSRRSWRGTDWDLRRRNESDNLVLIVKVDGEEKVEVLHR